MNLSQRGRGLNRRRLLAATGAALAVPAIHARAQAAGVALVIGNSKYQWEASLPNVRRDVPEMAKRFQAMGLKTDLVQDAGRDAMQRAIDAFAAASRGASLAAFYFAGHGAAWAKDTFLVPVDADLSDPATVRNLIKVASLRDGLAQATHRLLVFDNCRNNPADGWRQQEAADFSGAYVGMGSNAPPDTLALFSTAPGRVAVDGPSGDFSPFAAALMRQFEAPQIDLMGLPALLRRDVLIATQGRQVVFDNNSYRQPFQVRGARGAAPAGGRAGWAADPSRIVEVPNAYAFAQQSGLLLPPGLIAHRPAAGAPNAQMIGAYKFTDAFGGPAVSVIISVEEPGYAEVITSLRERASGNLGWRFNRATVSGKSLELLPSAKARPVQWTWSDANTGRLTILGASSGGKASASTPFARLDG